MTSVFQLYGRPLAENEPPPPLRITGELEGYTSGEAYEGRLQIVDSIGKCVVEIVESDLPPGAYAFVDNFTKEIVLRWPSYSPPGAPAVGVRNGDFELGNDGSWRFGAGWSIGAGGAETGTYSGVFQNHRGSSSIESARVPYVPGTVINASCRFQQGASSSGNLVGRILLVWCDENGNALPGGEGVSWTGGTIIRSGSNGEWQTSEVTGSSPTAKTVAVGFNADRRKQNKLARVDNFTWNHEYSVGTNSELDFTVTFKVTDSLNRIAFWSGSIVVHEAPPYVSLIHFDNYTGEFPDETEKTWTVVGAVSTTTGVFNSAGSFSSGAYQTTPLTSDWDFGSGEWTIDFWVRRAGPWAAGFVGIFGTSGAYSPGDGWHGITVLSSFGNLTLEVGSPVGGPGFAINGSALPSDSWVHICVSRANESFAGEGDRVRLFMNGVQQGAAIQPQGAIFLPPGFAQLNRGRLGSFSSSALSYDEFRCIKGVGIRTNFTPPTEPYP